MECKPVIKAIVAAMTLLENSGSDEIEPDTAVQGLEAIGYELLQLADQDRPKFIRARAPGRDLRDLDAGVG